MRSPDSTRLPTASVLVSNHEQPDAGMAAAVNPAFAASSGEWVSLDADDVLHHDCAATALARVSPDAAKVHRPLRLVDAEGRSFGLNPSCPARSPRGTWPTSCAGQGPTRRSRPRATPTVAGTPSS